MIQRPSTWWSPCAPRKLLNGSNGIVDQSLHLLQRLRTSNDLPVDQECRGTMHAELLCALTPALQDRSLTCRMLQALTELCRAQAEFRCQLKEA